MSTSISEQELQNAHVTFALSAQMVYAEPDETWVLSLLENRIFDEIPFGAQNAYIKRGLDSFRSWLEHAQKEDLNKAVSSLKSEWLMVLAGAGTPEAPCWQSYYNEAHSQIFSEKTLEVRRWYKQYGLMVQNQNKEPDDHLGIMLGFVAHLITLEIDTLLSSKQQEMEEIQKAQEEFMVEHILPWLPAWHFLLLEHARSDYYRGLAQLVFGLCEEYVVRFGITYDSVQERFFYKTK